MVALVSVSVALIALILVGSVASIVSKRKEDAVSSLPGNAKEYDLETVERKEPSALTGKNILFLGSSVTLGSAACEVSFVDYIGKRNGATCVKEAVEGTTLVDGKNSYFRRLKTVENEKFDLFVCQLSTNDANQKKPIGTVDDETDDTVLGAAHAITFYAKRKWNCPVVFYTNAYYKNEYYAAMVSGLKRLAEKEDFGLLDLYTDKAFNDISREQRSLFTADAVHPTKAGYLLWWTPKTEKYLNEYLLRVR